MHALDARRWKRSPLPQGVLLAIAGHRVRAVSTLRNAREHDPVFRQRIDALQSHTRDAQGRNWDIPASTRGRSQPAGYEADFGRTVDAKRDKFDLA